MERQRQKWRVNMDEQRVSDVVNNFKEWHKINSAIIRLYVFLYANLVNFVLQKRCHNHISPRYTKTIRMLNCVCATNNNHKTQIIFPSLTWVATIILRQVMDSRYSTSFNERNSELDNLYQPWGVWYHVWQKYYIP